MARISLNQIFRNPLPSPIEAVYYLPVDPNAAICSFKFKIRDKEISSQVVEKEQAEEKYEDSVAQGKAAAIAKYSGEKTHLLKVALGNILPGQEVQATVEVV